MPWGSLPIASPMALFYPLIREIRTISRPKTFIVRALLSTKTFKQW